MAPDQVDSEMVGFDLSCREIAGTAKVDPPSGQPSASTSEPWPGMRCRAFDPSEVAVAPFKGDTGLVAPGGVLVLGGFGARGEAAARTLEFIRFYGIDRVCPVGDPQTPVLDLFTHGGKLPAGAMPGESCDPAFGVKTLAVREGKGRWRVETAQQVLLGSFPDEPGARRYADELFRLGARYLCAVGGPTPALRYLRR
jgi:hypothetical protein